jgi:site-specific recombinase XerD
MKSYYFDDVVEGLRPMGCVIPYIKGFIAPMIETGYTFLCTRDYARAAGHLGRWMDVHGLDVERLTDPDIEQFAEHRCTCPGTSRPGSRPARRYVKRVRRFIEHLRQVGVVQVAPDLPSQFEPASLRGFRHWMIQHRGVTDRTMGRYERLVSRMLPGLGDDPAAYDAELVRRVFLEQVRGRGPVYAKDFITALRSFLRFLAIEGRCRPGLDHAVPNIPQWRLSTLPRYLDSEIVEQVIASCDLGNPQGIRDRAVLLLLARLGLRAGDIVSMRLADIDWNAGTLKVRGKSRREVLLPLPQDTGDAVLRYLVDVRPSAATDRVFLCLNAPTRPLAGSPTVSCIVRRSLQQAGVTDAPSWGAHLLRHSAATTMIRSGASLDTIATVLRHQSADTTAYYAKVDVELLRKAAQPWPEGTSC